MISTRWSNIIIYSPHLNTESFVQLREVVVAVLRIEDRADLSMD
jgi:hypothetical protein